MKVLARMGLRRRPALVLLALPYLACAGQPAATAASQAPCASINDDVQRLACYDKQAGRGAAPAAAAPAAVAPAAAAPAAAVPQQPTAPSAVAASSPSPAPQSFGLYSAEHPKPPPANRKLEARVIGLGASADGRMTVSLEGGAVWELRDEEDPLLAAGDTVTIRRGTLGSFLMDTPTKRTHRVRRLR